MSQVKGVEGGPNAAQRAAIEHVDGPLLIIAGPGSGKTFTLVERVVHLITARNLPPERLLVVTFTDKAAAELRTRVTNRLNELGMRFNLNEMYLGTFHSVCLRWLEEYREFTRLKRNFTLMDQFDQQYFIFQRLRDYEAISGISQLVSVQSAWARAVSLVKLVNQVSEEALPLATLLDAPDEIVRVLGQVARLYQQQIEEENALDFSTIQAEALRLLRGDLAARDGLREKLAYVMVDEYQDTNTIQELILGELVGERPNLCVVGDDDQGLYRFRGATIQNILQFKEKFPPEVCDQVTLTVNYRSRPGIIEFYNRWMARLDWHAGKQSFRYAKKIVEEAGRTFPPEPAVVKVGAAGEDAWHAEALAFLHGLREAGTVTDWNQVAFLFRSVKNDKVVALAEYLEQHDVPVYAPRSNQFFEREEIRLMVGALIALFPQFVGVRVTHADVALEIWEYYDEQCARAFVNEVMKPEHEGLRKWVGHRRKDHHPMTRNMDYGFTGLFYELLRFPLFSRYLAEDRLTGGVQESRAMRNLATFSQMLAKFEYLHRITVLTPQYLEKNLKDLFNRFLRFLKEGGIDEYEDEAEYAPSGCVSFLTIHQAKGLEFPVVVVGSLEAVPRKSYTALDEVLQSGYLARPAFEPLARIKEFDFWRLYYAAFSRAQNLLALTAAEKRKGQGQCPSRYLQKVYDELPDWRHADLAAIPALAVKTVKLKREYSFTSHVAVYENCAEQYRFFKELEFAPVRGGPMLFGTVVHQTIEDIHKAVLRGETGRLSEGQVGAWFDTNYAFLTKRERVYLTPQQRNLALQDVLRYWRRHNGDWSRIREAEVDVSLVKDEYILSGTVDLIEGAGNTVEIIDFKSERKPDVNDPADRQRIERYQRQLEVYAHIVEERTGRKVSKTHLYYTREEDGVPTISFATNSHHIQRTIDVIDGVVGRIEAKDFRLAARPAKLCKECDLRAYCDAKTWNYRRE